jgi:hypothetical protein
MKELPRRIDLAVLDRTGREGVVDGFRDRGHQ